MIITLRYWKLTGTKSLYPGQPDYSQRIEKAFRGKNAAECMQKVNEYKHKHDLSKYTEAEIIDVED